MQIVVLSGIQVSLILSWMCRSSSMCVTSRSSCSMLLYSKQIAVKTSYRYRRSLLMLVGCFLQACVCLYCKSDITILLSSAPDHLNHKGDTCWHTASLSLVKARTPCVHCHFVVSWTHCHQGFSWSFARALRVRQGLSW